MISTSDVIKLEIKMKKDDLFPTYIATSEAKRNLVEALDEVEEYGRPAQDAIKRGIKGLDGFLSELELYLEV